MDSWCPNGIAYYIHTCTIITIKTCRKIASGMWTSLASVMSTVEMDMNYHFKIEFILNWIVIHALSLEG